MTNRGRPRKGRDLLDPITTRIPHWLKELIITAELSPSELMIQGFEQYFDGSHPNNKIKPEIIEAYIKNKELDIEEQQRKKARAENLLAELSTSPAQAKGQLKVYDNELGQVRFIQIAEYDPRIHKNPEAVPV